ncbi:hypothetical protein [Nocardiopsis sp. FIRDI 009]|uniref:hypothetical protein n=1 Tax=Nocardiopsis sp. FIRDI 009 TaxID=714197 RepID=UPI0013006794|nr:hypothetical protein [Nocardiopsis sp. FIRDI 009]
MRSAPAGADVTAVVVTGAPGEGAPLARLAVARVCGALRAALPEPARPRLRLVLDGDGRVAAAAGVAPVGDTTEAAVRVEAGRITAGAVGRGAGHAVATRVPADHR